MTTDDPSETRNDTTTADTTSTTIEPPSGATPPEPRDRPRSSATRRRVGTAVATAITVGLALFLFVLAVQMMRTGGASVAPRIEVFRWNALSTLGLGAILAYVWLSGKPVAGIALALFVAGGLTRLQAFTMLSGGRMGAAFIVLLVGFMYFVRGQSRNRRESIGVGVLALALTAAVYVPGMLVGYAILKTGALNGVDTTSSGLQSALDDVWRPIVDWMAKGLPDALLLPLGAAVIVLAIRLLDRALPQFRGAPTPGDRASKGPSWSLFALGFGITLVTFSVSVALTVLVPLAARGSITRRQAIPYIMGANVSTLVDTLLVAVLYNNSVGVQIVLAEAIGVAAVTLFCMLLLYRPLSTGLLAIDDWVVATNRRLAVFCAALFLLPALLVGAGFALGPTG